MMNIEVKLRDINIYLFPCYIILFSRFNAFYKDGYQLVTLVF